MDWQTSKVHILIKAGFKLKKCFIYICYSNSLVNQTFLFSSSDIFFSQDEFAMIYFTYTCLYSNAFSRGLGKLFIDSKPLVGVSFKDGYCGNPRIFIRTSSKIDLVGFYIVSSKYNFIKT